MRGFCDLNTVLYDDLGTDLAYRDDIALGGDAGPTGSQNDIPG